LPPPHRRRVTGDCMQCPPFGCKPIGPCLGWQGRPRVCTVVVQTTASGQGPGTGSD
jgi:hypothetical protein